MFVMPDGASFEMHWKQVIYTNHGNSITFQIIPMMQGKDAVVFPNEEAWKKIENIFPQNERLEIFFLLERIGWKREVGIWEVNCEPSLCDGFPVQEGMLEATPGYKQIDEKRLFDPDCQFTMEQVKQVYLKMEKKFAEAVVGNVTVPRELRIKGSVFEEVTVPTLLNNPNAKVTL